MMKFIYNGVTAFNSSQDDLLQRCFLRCKVKLLSLNVNVLQSICELRSKLRERCLRLIYIDKKFSLDELFALDDIVSLQHQIDRRLHIEMFQIITGKSPEIVKENFHVTDQGSYQLRQKSYFPMLTVNPVFSGRENIRFLSLSKDLGSYTR